MQLQNYYVAQWEIADIASSAPSTRLFHARVHQVTILFLLNHSGRCFTNPLAVYTFLHAPFHCFIQDEPSSSLSPVSSSTSSVPHTVRHPTMPDGFDYLFKLLLIGDSGVGKVSLLLAYVGYIMRMLKLVVVMFVAPIRRRRIHRQLPQYDWCRLQDSHN